MKYFNAHKADLSGLYKYVLGLIFTVAVMAVSAAASTPHAGVKPAQKSSTTSIPPLDLRSTANFVILAGSTVTDIPAVSITGDVGLSPAAGSYISGFSGADVIGTLYVVDASGPAGSVQNATLLQTAKSDLTIAYNDAAGRTPVPTGTFLNPGGGNIGGLNLVAGLYKFTSSAAITGSNLTLTGSATDVWIFQIGTSLNLGNGIHIILAGGAQAANIFWQVGSSATLGSYSVFKGTILADQSVTMGTGASMDGRALAFSAAVTMASGVTTTKPVLTFSPIFSVNPMQVAFGNVNSGLSKKDSVTVTNTGTADLVISSVTSSNALFAVTPTSGTITPNSTQKFYVTFAPLTNGLQNGSIDFHHNAANATDSISASGTGVGGVLVPRFSASPLSLNFGNVNNATSKKDTVTVTNTGTADLIISSVTSSNALFAVTPTSGTITPNSTQYFYVTFAPLTNGLQNGSIDFHHNAANAQDSIHVSGTGIAGAIAPKFSASPLSLNFGNVNNATSKKDTVTVTNTGTADLIISSVTSSNALFAVTPTSGIITPNSTRYFYVTFAPLTNGLQNGFIDFNHNAANATDSIQVRGSGVSVGLTPKFSVNPLSLNFGTVNDAVMKRDSVTVTNTGTADLIISGITSSNTLFTVTPATGTIKPGLMRKFYVTFAPIADGMQNGAIYFNHNAPNAKDSINVGGTGVSPVFSATIASLDFGNVNNDITKIDSVTITNTGTADLIISGFSSSNTHFTITALGATIPPGSSQKFHITFTPLTAGFQSGYVYFYHNATNAKDSIYVSGTGVGSSAFPVFSANLMSLDFGNVNSGATKEDSVIITNTGTANLIIFGITSGNVFYAVNPGLGMISAGASQKFHITFAPLTAGFQGGYIYFNHNATNAEDSIYVSGTGVGNDLAPKFSASITNLDFGTVFIGKTKQKSVIVTNTGTTILIISNISSMNAQYAIAPIIGMIEPGASLEFFITFAPTIASQVNAKILFTHNAGRDTITVSGTGLAALPVITIQAARDLPIGTEFAIEGVVTRALGNYTRIQDQTGAITIIQESGLLFFNEVANSDIQMADRLRVQGRISEQNFLKVIAGADLTGDQRISRMNTLPTPVKMTLSELAANGEQYESRLITLENLAIASGGDMTFQEAKTYQVVDGSDNTNKVVIRIGNNVDTDMSGMPFIGTAVTFTGVLSQSSESDPAGGYQLTPVLSTDLLFIPTTLSETIHANQYSLSNNYPNPFHGTTTIQYSLENADFVLLKVFTVLGREVATLVNGFRNAGSHSVSFSAGENNSSLRSGVYFYRIEIGTAASTKQMIFVK